MSKLSPDQWPVLSPRLDEALEMTEDQRSTWLSSLQTVNPILASQLELLLDEGHFTRQFQGSRFEKTLLRQQAMLFVSTLAPGGAILLHVSLNGEAQPIWHRPESTHTWGFPSPDGSHLAILNSNSESNVWMVNNF
jgi:hypothetical protein